MFSFTSTAKTAVAGAAIAAAVALPLLIAPAAFAVDACFAPTAVSDSYSMVQDTTLTVDAASGTLQNDQAGGCPDFVMNGVTVAPEGDLWWDFDGSFIFTPAPGFVGTVHYLYRDSTAGGGYSDYADLTIEVTAAPIPGATVNPDVYETFVNTPLVLDLAGGVLANDLDAWHVNAQDEAQGEISMNADGAFTYTPALDFVGTKTFNYNALSFDGVSVSAWTSVTITVKPITIIPSIPVGNPGGGNPGDPGDGTGGDLPTLAYTGTDDVTAWLIAPALALLIAGGAAVWFARRRSSTN